MIGLTEQKNNLLEHTVFRLLDEYKVLFFPSEWSGIFLDFSKNEILVMLYLYRMHEGNMTQLSEYIQAPLNTTTGVVGRLERKEMVERLRSTEDRRIVNIRITDHARAIVQEEKDHILTLISEVYGSLSEEERTASVNIFKKVTAVLRNRNKITEEPKQEAKKIKRIVIE